MDLHHRRGDLEEERFLLGLFVDPAMNGFAEGAYCCCYCNNFHESQCDKSRYICINVIENSMIRPSTTDLNGAIGGEHCQIKIAHSYGFTSQ